VWAGTAASRAAIDYIVDVSVVTATRWPLVLKQDDGAPPAGAGADLRRIVRLSQRLALEDRVT
jgi:hypothetical protein